MNKPFNSQPMDIYLMHTGTNTGECTSVSVMSKSSIYCSNWLKVKYVNDSTMLFHHTHLDTNAQNE